MAIFHLSVKTVSRSAGRSAVAAAAYRAGERLMDERSGLEHDYTRKSVDETFTLTPEGAEWAQDRGQLWNAAEKAEVRKNATVAREYELALPAELSREQRSELVRGFGQELVERYGVAVDVGIHAPDRQGDQRNWHAHVLTTTRTVGPDGLGEKTRVLDAKATGPGEVEILRERWAHHTNQALERALVPERVDHRSHQRQGLEQTPTGHLGPLVVGMERRAMREQGFSPKGGLGIVQAMSAPGFEPATERGRNTVMIGIGNQPPHADSMSAAACRVADLILIPCRPRAFDLDAIETTADLVKASGKPAFVVFTAGPQRAIHLYREAAEIVAGFGLSVAPVVMSERAAYHHATGAGRTAPEIEPDGRAAEEVAALWAWVRQRANVSTRQRANKEAAA